MDHLKIAFIISCILTVVLCSDNQNSTNNQFVTLDIFPDEFYQDILIKNNANGRSGRIVMGKFAASNQFPYYGYLLIYRPTTSTFCGSSLISSDWVVTAAHCMRTAVSAMVYFGSVDRNYFQASRNAQGYISHESHDKPTALANDISVIKLTSPVPLSSSIAVIQLPARSEKSKSFKDVTLTSVGFGKTEDGYPRYLQYTTITGFANNECLRYHYVFIDSMLCGRGVQSAGSSVCFGDSGGPLTASVGGITTFVGISSYVQTDQCINDVQGFTRVDNYLDWITAKTGIYTRW